MTRSTIRLEAIRTVTAAAIELAGDEPEHIVGLLMASAALVLVGCHTTRAAAVQHGAMAGPALAEMVGQIADLLGDAPGLEQMRVEGTA